MLRTYFNTYVHQLTRHVCACACGEITPSCGSMQALAATGIARSESDDAARTTIFRHHGAPAFRLLAHVTATAHTPSPHSRARWHSHAQETQSSGRLQVAVAILPRRHELGGRGSASVALTLSAAQAGGIWGGWGVPVVGRSGRTSVGRCRVVTQTAVLTCSPAPIAFSCHLCMSKAPK